MRTIDLREPMDVACGERTVRLDPAGELSLSGSHDRRLRTDVSGSSHAVVWSGEDWCGLIGLQGRDVVVVRPSEDEIFVAGQLDRLDLHDGYDPGGMHRIEIEELPGGDILLIHELGLARVSAAGIQWQRRHEDLTARVAAIADGVVWLVGESEQFGYDLEHGDPKFAREA